MSADAKETYKLSHLSDNDLLKEIYERYGKKLYSYALRTWKLEEDDAWDLIYKTLEKVVSSYTNYTFESESKFASFVFKVFINYLRNHYRAGKRIPLTIPFTDKDGHTSHPDASMVSANPRLTALNEELEKMEDWQRMLLLMRSEGHAYSEIAKFIDRPENQLKVYYQRLKEQLSKKLHERE